ncbi:hypothetical protein N9L68_01950 [bacterium]|nr:hypothetical protein [bacterium]
MLDVVIALIVIGHVSADTIIFYYYYYYYYYYSCYYLYDGRRTNK